MRRIAIIPARSGSKGLPNKNVRPLLGKPLMAYTIEAANKSGLFDRVFVSTDSKEYQRIAEECGGEAPFLRTENLSGDITSSWDVVAQVLRVFAKRGEEFDEIALLQPTSPLRNAQDIINAYEIMEERDANAVVAVTVMEHSPLWCNLLPEDGSMAGFIRPEAIRVPRQGLPDYYQINGSIYWIKKECLEQIEDLYENRCFAYKMPVERSVDIDTLLDFCIAETILKTRELQTGQLWKVDGGFQP